jgi:hypothetical protein
MKKKKWPFGTPDPLLLFWYSELHFTCPGFFHLSASLKYIYAYRPSVSRKVLLFEI